MTGSIGWHKIAPAAVSPDIYAAHECGFFMPGGSLPRYRCPENLM